MHVYIFIKNNISMCTMRKVLLHVINQYFSFPLLWAVSSYPLPIYLLSKLNTHFGPAYEELTSLLTIIYFEEIRTIPFQSSNALVYIKQVLSIKLELDSFMFNIYLLDFSIQGIVRGCSDPNSGLENNHTSLLTISGNFRMKGTQARLGPPNTQLPTTKSLCVFPCLS